MRVCYVVPSLGFGGAERFLLDLIRTLPSEWRFQVLCLYRGGPLKSGFEECGARVEILGLRHIADGPGLISAVRSMRSFQPDVVHTKIVHADLLGTIAARLSGVPTLVSTVESVHEWQGEKTLRRRLKLRMAAAGYRHFSAAVVAVSEGIKDCLVSAARLAGDKVHIIPNGVDTERFCAGSLPPREDVRRSLGFQPEDMLIGTVGRLVPIKNQALLLEAVARLQPRPPTLKCLLIGDGKDRDELEARAADLGLGSAVRFLGHRTDVAELLHALDIFVLPSSSEGLSVILLEAMAMEKPIVATAVGGNAELIEEGSSGRLVPSGDPEVMAGAISALLASPEQARALGRSARLRAAQRFDLQSAARRYEAIYKRLAYDRPNTD